MSESKDITNAIEFLEFAEYHTGFITYMLNYKKTGELRDRQHIFEIVSKSPEFREMILEFRNSVYKRAKELKEQGLLEIDD